MKVFEKNAMKQLPDFKCEKYVWVETELIDILD